LEQKRILQQLKKENEYFQKMVHAANPGTPVSSAFSTLPKTFFQRDNEMDEDHNWPTIEDILEKTKEKKVSSISQIID